MWSRSPVVLDGTVGFYYGVPLVLNVRARPDHMPGLAMKHLFAGLRADRLILRDRPQATRAEEDAGVGDSQLRAQGRGQQSVDVRDVEHTGDGADGAAPGDPDAPHATHEPRHADAALARPPAAREPALGQRRVCGGGGVDGGGAMTLQAAGGGNRALLGQLLARSLLIDSLIRWLVDCAGAGQFGLPLDSYACEKLPGAWAGAAATCAIVVDLTWLGLAGQATRRPFRWCCWCSGARSSRGAAWRRCPRLHACMHGATRPPLLDLCWRACLQTGIFRQMPQLSEAHRRQVAEARGRAACACLRLID